MWLNFIKWLGDDKIALSKHEPLAVRKTIDESLDKPKSNSRFGASRRSKRSI